MALISKYNGPDIDKFKKTPNNIKAYTDTGTRISAVNNNSAESYNFVKDKGDTLNHSFNSYIKNQSNTFQLVDYYDKTIKDISAQLNDLHKQILKKQSEIDSINNRQMSYQYGDWAQEALNPGINDEKISKLQREMEELQAEYNTKQKDLYSIQELRNIAFQSAYSLYSEADDFEEKAVSKVARLEFKAIGADEDDLDIKLVAYDKDGNVIEDAKEIALYCRLNPDASARIKEMNVNVTSVKEYEENTLKYLSDDEVSTLAYLYNIGDKDKLEKYIKHLENCASARKGQEQAQDIIKQIDEIYAKVGTITKTTGMGGPVNIEYTEASADTDVAALLAKTGFNDGLSNFFEGLKNASPLVEVDASLTAEQYKTRFLIQNLQERYGEEGFK